MFISIFMLWIFWSQIKQIKNICIHFSLLFVDLRYNSAVCFCKCFFVCIFCKWCTCMCILVAVCACLSDVFNNPKISHQIWINWMVQKMWEKFKTILIQQLCIKLVDGESFEFRCERKWLGWWCRCRMELLTAIVTMTVWQRKRQIKIANIVLIYTWAQWHKCWFGLMSGFMCVSVYGARDERASYVFGLVYAIHLLSSAALISPSLIQNVSKIYFEHGNIAVSAIKWAHFDETKWVSNLKSFMESQFLAETLPKPFWDRIKIVDIIDFCSSSC